MKFCLPLLLLLVGCSYLPSNARRIVEAQTPGSATGAGASLNGPSNSAAPSTQQAEKVTVYSPSYLPPLSVGVPSFDTRVQPAVTPPSVPSWVFERSNTSLGQHQDASSIIKVAGEMVKWSKVTWVGLLCIIVSLGGLLYSYNNEESGYTVVWLKVGGIGVLLMLVGDNPFWLLLLLIPALFYVAQKFNLLRLP